MRHTEDKGKWIQPGPPLPFQEIIKDGLYIKRRIKAGGQVVHKYNNEHCLSLSSTKQISNITLA